MQNSQTSFTISFQGEISHILCQPIVQPDGALAAVLELWRKETGGPFHEEDEEITCSYLVWGGIALHYAHLYLNMDKQRKLNDFLLAVVKWVSSRKEYLMKRSRIGRKIWFRAFAFCIPKRPLKWTRFHLEFRANESFKIWMQSAIDSHIRSGGRRRKKDDAVSSCWERKRI